MNNDHIVTAVKDRLAEVRDSLGGGTPEHPGQRDYRQSPPAPRTPPRGLRRDRSPGPGGRGGSCPDRAAASQSSGHTGPRAGHLLRGPPGRGRVCQRRPGHAADQVFGRPQQRRRRVLPAGPGHAVHRRIRPAYHAHLLRHPVAAADRGQPGARVGHRALRVPADQLALRQASQRPAQQCLRLIRSQRAPSPAGRGEW